MLMIAKVRKLYLDGRKYNIMSTLTRQNNLLSDKIRHVTFEQENVTINISSGTKF